MANPIRPSELPPGNPTPSAEYIFDTGAQVLKTGALAIIDSVIPLASQQQAEDGADNETRVSPLRVKQAIDSRVVIATEGEASNLDEDTASNLALMTPLRIISALKSFEPLDMRWFGADGSDGLEASAARNTQAFQEAFDALEEANAEYFDIPGGNTSSGLPGGGRPFYNLIGREINCHGGVYGLDGPIDFRANYGLTLKNATFIAYDGSWSTSNAVLRCTTNQAGSPYHPSQTIGIVIEDVVVNCNERAPRGIWISGGNRMGRISNNRVFGFGMLNGAVGIQVDDSIETLIENNYVFGTNMFQTDAPPGINNAIGILCNAGDSEVLKNKVFRVYTGIEIGDKSGIMVMENHAHGYAVGQTRPAIYVNRPTATGLVMIHSNYLDNSTVRVKGARNVEVINNRQLSNAGINGPVVAGTFIQLEAREPNERLSGFAASGNRAQGPLIPPSEGGINYAALTMIEEGGNSWGELGINRVDSWDITSSTNFGTEVFSKVTQGSRRTVVTTDDFDGLNQVFIDLNPFLVMPTAPAPAQFDLLSCLARGTGPGSPCYTPDSWNYNRTTGVLRLGFAAPFDGYILFNFTWGLQTRNAGASSS